MTTPEITPEITTPRAQPLRSELAPITIAADRGGTVIEFVPNTAQRGDALTLLRSLPTGCTPLMFFDPQHRSVLDKLKFGNEGKSRQRGRAKLPAMTEEYIDSVIIESARVLKPSGYLMRWIDTFCLCEAHQLRIAPNILKTVHLIAWDNLRVGQGKRVRHRGDYLLVLQKPPLKASATWHDHGISNRWPEKVDRKLHPHIKPVRLITRLINAVTQPGELVVDPAAGSFVVMHAANGLGRNFIGCDLVEINSMTTTIGVARKKLIRRADQAEFEFEETRARKRGAT